MDDNKATKSDSTEAEKDMVLHFTKTFSDTAREPFLILNSDLVVVGANASFYKNFQVTKEETENKLVYDLGNGQWNIPELKNLLEKILPDKRVFNDFEVSHDFPNIGLRTMLLNARKLDTTQQILLAIEDITFQRVIKTRLDDYTKALEGSEEAKKAELQFRINELSEMYKYTIKGEIKVIELKKEIKELEKEGA